MGAGQSSFADTTHTAPKVTISNPILGVSNTSNNQRAVAGLLAYHLNHAQALANDSSSSSSSSSNTTITTATTKTPPPGCPMHQTTSTTALPPSPPTASPKMPTSSSGQCPVPHDQRASMPSSSSPSSSSSTTASASARSWSSTLNPLNMMPSLSQNQAPEQKTILSTERTVSSIPRSKISSPPPGASPYDKPQPSSSGCPVKHGDEQGEADQDRWEYPSPQQFYNALVRKGWETPEEHVETMVLIHNFLNERAWLEVLEWEKRAGSDPDKVELARFQGRPGTLSPKARLYGLAGWLMPEKFGTDPPFDRHDWVVRRPETGEEVRYVIDYYAVPDDPNKDEPEFNLDIRPALDSLSSAKLRFEKVWEEYRNGEGIFAKE
ncbi:hypothetical protein IE53DRAFT_388230 [Violaceomyces palustris]|uniref:Uncharacterized protein n=1 Tax=Violaceomyces palustris TaxID=1673888 RepID=A0ACD0NUU9_9BASI|nr:hypothetical protein IE53DRAFT_388230 [Violaceomyces palustris]